MSQHFHLQNGFLRIHRCNVKRFASDNPRFIFVQDTLRLCFKILFDISIIMDAFFDPGLVLAREVRDRVRGFIEKENQPPKAIALENHGFFANGCDRCERLVRAVNRDNYKMLLDTGNIVCVDEDPAVAAKRLAPLCEMIHLKDFYIRRRDPGDTTEFDCAGSWFRSNHGRYLRGAIMGQGDMDMYEILGIIKRSGYNGDIAIEFEGFEEPKYATRVSLDNAKRIWKEV